MFHEAIQKIKFSRGKKGKGLLSGSIVLEDSMKIRQKLKAVRFTLGTAELEAALINLFPFPLAIIRTISPLHNRRGLRKRCKEIRVQTFPCP